MLSLQTWKAHFSRLEWRWHVALKVCGNPSRGITCERRDVGGLWEREPVCNVRVARRHFGSVDYQTDEEMLVDDWVFKT